MRRTIGRIWRETGGVTALEFALVLPVIAIVAAGTIEFGRLVILTQKLQNGTFILADLGARGGSHTGDLQDSRRRGGFCPRDGAALQRRTIGGRTTYSCPEHQR